MMIERLAYLDANLLVGQFSAVLSVSDALRCDACLPLKALLHARFDLTVHS